MAVIEKTIEERSLLSMERIFLEGNFNKKYFKFILKLAVSLSLLWYVLSIIDVSALVVILSSIHMPLLSLAVMLICIEKLVASFRWYLLLQSMGSSIAFTGVLRIYLVSGSLGSFLPGGIGTEVVKVYSFSSGSEKIPQVLGSILVERFLGFISLFIVSFVCILIAMKTMLEIENILFIFIFVSICLTLLLVLLFCVSHKAFMDRLACYRHYWFIRKIIKVFTGIGGLYTNKVVLGQCLFFSFVIHFLRILIVFYFARSIAIHTPIIHFFIFIPIIFFIRQIPISINGIGLSQGLYAWFFGGVGMSTTEAFSLSTGLMILGYVTIVIGGILYMTSGVAPGDQRVDQNS